MAKYIETHNRAVVIFPEGSRSRDGKPKPFKTKGLQTLIGHAPNALIAPMTINNSWKLLRYGKFPYGIGTHITFEVHKPMEIGEKSAEALIQEIEKTITGSVVV